MPLLNEQLLRQNPALSKKSQKTLEKELSQPLKKNPAELYDVFLSHRSQDAQIIYSLKKMLESFRLTVFVDWIEVPELSRANVNIKTANRLRAAMRQSKSLLFAVSNNSSKSSWMPWELGYSDALHGRVAIVPIFEGEMDTESYKGQEYLGLYPYITLAESNSNKKLNFWVNKTANTYAPLTGWIKGENLTRRIS